MADIPATIVDPDHVPELLCTGPVNLWLTGPVGTLTFTHLRKPPEKTLADAGEDVQGVVRARIVMPLEGLVELAALINRLIHTKPIAPGSTARN